MERYQQLYIIASSMRSLRYGYINSWRTKRSGATSVAVQGKQPQQTTVGLSSKFEMTSTLVQGASNIYTNITLQYSNAIATKTMVLSHTAAKQWDSSDSTQQGTEHLKTVIAVMRWSLLLLDFSVFAVQLSRYKSREMDNAWSKPMNIVRKCKTNIKTNTPFYEKNRLSPVKSAASVTAISLRRYDMRSRGYMLRARVAATLNLSFSRVRG